MSLRTNEGKGCSATRKEGCVWWSSRHQEVELFVLRDEDEDEDEVIVKH